MLKQALLAFSTDPHRAMPSSSSSLNGFLFEEQMARTSTWSLSRLKKTIHIRTLNSITKSSIKVTVQQFPGAKQPRSFRVDEAPRSQPFYLLQVSCSKDAHREPS